jgi:hypothetical protein
MAKLREYLARHSIAVVALLFAIGGGGAYAAATVDSGDIKDNSVKGRDIANHGVKLADLASLAGGYTTQVTNKDFEIGPDSSGELDLQCPNGGVAVGAGTDTSVTGVPFTTSSPLNEDGDFAHQGETPVGWEAQFTNEGTGYTGQVQLTLRVICFG